MAIQASLNERERVKLTLPLPHLPLPSSSARSISFYPQIVPGGHLSVLELDGRLAYISIETSIWAQIAGLSLWLHEGFYAPSLPVMGWRKSLLKKS